MLAGALNLASMARLLKETDDYTNQTALPAALSINFSEVTEVDSSAVALMLHWRRKALQLNKPLRYVHLPHNLEALAELYGVDQLIHCPSQQKTKQPSSDQSSSAAAPST